MTDSRPTARDDVGAGAAAVQTSPSGAESAAAEPPAGDPEIRARSQWELFRRKFFRHKLAMGSLVVFLLIAFASVFAEWVAPYGFNDINVLMASTAPTLENNHFFGTDQLGRDYFSRTLFGTRTSLRVAFVVAIVSTGIGTVIGAVAGYYRGWVDAILMRFTDLVLIVPALAILLTAAALLGQGSPMGIALILAALFWVQLARIVRGSFMSLREKEYVEAAKAAGAGDLRIMFRHMLPNAMGPIIVNMTLIIATAILVEATLSFLGFGINPPNPALGRLIQEGRSAMLTSWWLVVMPGLTLVTICLTINFIGDGLRDALDPTQSER